MPKPTPKSIETSIREFFSDTSVPSSDTRMYLEDLRDIIDELLDTLPSEEADEDEDSNDDAVDEFDEDALDDSVDA